MCVYQECVYNNSFYNEINKTCSITITKYDNKYSES